MKRIYYPYTEWEDYLHGMYRKEKDKDYTLDSFNLLTNLEDLYKAMKTVSESWTKCASMNLTNSSINHQAWLGQSACCFSFKAPEEHTRNAWWMMTDRQRIEANKIADQVKKEWLEIYKYGKQLSLFYFVYMYI